LHPPVEQGVFTEYLRVPIKGRTVRLLIDGEMAPDVLTSLGRHLRLLRDDLPDDADESPSEPSTEEGSVIANEPADSLLDENADGQNGRQNQ